jgi:hypothetical protein
VLLIAGDDRAAVLERERGDPQVVVPDLVA